MPQLVNELNANDFAIVNLKEDADPSSAVRRDFVTAQIAAIAEKIAILDAKLLSLNGNQNVKSPCTVAITEDFNLNSGGSPTVQGVIIGQNTRVLLTNQKNPGENGIYLARPGAWIRSFDANDPSDFSYGFVVEVLWGNEENKGFWNFTTTGQIDLDVTPLVFKKQTDSTSPPSRGVIGISDGGTGGTTPEAARKNLGVAEEITFAPLGDGKTKVFVIPHALNNAGILEPSVIDLVTNKYVQASTKILDANNIEITFGRPPADQSIAVTVVGIRR
jgi:hypothetical protein